MYGWVGGGGEGTVGNDQAPSWSFKSLQAVNTHLQTHTWSRGGCVVVWRVVAGGGRQLLVFQKRLAPGSTVNNELILSARARRNTAHLFWNKQPYSSPH